MLDHKDLEVGTFIFNDKDCELYTISMICEDGVLVEKVPHKLITQDKYKNFIIVKRYEEWF